MSRAWVVMDRPGGGPPDDGEPPARSLTESGAGIGDHCRGGDWGATNIVATDGTSEVFIAVGLPRARGFVGLVETVPGSQAARFVRRGRDAVAP